MDVITGEDDLGMQGYIMFGMQYAILNAQHVATQIEINQIEKKPLWVTSDKQHELQGLLDALSHARNGEFLPMSDIFNSMSIAMEHHAELKAQGGDFQTAATLQLGAARFSDIGDAFEEVQGYSDF